MTTRFLAPAVLLFVFPCAASVADEVSLFFGAGSQPGSNQRNDIAGFEYAFYALERSSRQKLQVGVSVARWRTNALSSPELTAVSVYPQLTFYPKETSRLVERMPDSIRPFFYARMLGPAILSESALGDREQAHRFAFHAEVGAGAVLAMRRGRSALVRISWRHISNANLASPNDGIDVPFTISVGVGY